jgi:hypothetical protein
MRLNLLSDAHWESRVDKVLDDLSARGYRNLFAGRDYGKGLSGITVVFMCQDPDLNLKKRVRFDAAEKKVYLDIMLDLDRMRQAEPAVRRTTIAERLAQEVPAALRKYAISDFDEPRFVEDLNTWLKEIR